LYWEYYEDADSEYITTERLCFNAEFQAIKFLELRHNFELAKIETASRRKVIEWKPSDV
jgi:hypothetical protein